MSDQYAKELLLHKMREWSEECYCAGWMMGLEYGLWSIALMDRDHYGFHEFNHAEADELFQLAIDANGWWVWRDSDERETFIDLAEWVELYRKEHGDE